MRNACCLSCVTLVVVFVLTMNVSGQPAPPGNVYEALGALRWGVGRLPQITNFAMVAHHPLVNPPGSRASGTEIPRGMNAALALAKNCAYVGSRDGLQDVLIVDIAQPTNPTVTDFIPGIPLSTSRELRGVGDLDLLVVGDFRIRKGEPTLENPTDTDGTVNNFRIYDIADCKKPVLRATIDLGPNVYHEFYLWADPKAPRRVLLYATFTDTGSGRNLPDLRVFDISDAQRGVEPRQIASFTLDPAVPADARVNPNDPTQKFGDDQFQFSATDLSPWISPRFLFTGKFGPQPTTQVNNRLHSLSLNPQGTRVFMANLAAGFFILDSSNLADAAKAKGCIPDTVTREASANENKNLCLRKLNPDPNARVDWHPPEASITHTAVQMPGRPFVLVGDERNGTTACPWSYYRIIDIRDEMHPVIVSTLKLPENDPHNCRLGAPGDPKFTREFSAHNATVFRNLGFFTWYSGGLRAWEYADPRRPREVGVFVPKPIRSVSRPFRDSADVWAWSYPIVRDGLIYFVDIRNGLYIVKYTGPRSAEIPTAGVYAGNQTPSKQ